MQRFNFANDIPLNIAHSAHAGTSFFPDKRGDQERDSYAATLTADYTALSKYAETPEKRALLDQEFARYRAGYRAKVIVALGARSRCMSTMITGRSNFPVRRQQKRSETADKRADEMIAFRERALDAIRKVLCPELRPIMAGDADAVTRLRERIAKDEKAQELMKAANAAIRRHRKAGADAQVAALVALGLHEKRARDLLVPDFMGRIGFADYELTNNGKRIRDNKARLLKLESDKAQDDTEEIREHARLVDSPADNRVRLFFPGKPSAEVRARLKGAGFRFAPTEGNAWQAYRNHNSMVVARREAGPPVESKADAIVPVPVFIRTAEDGASERLTLVRIIDGALAGAAFPCAAMDGQEIPYLVLVTATDTAEEPVLCDLDGDQVDAEGCTWEVVDAAEEHVAKHLATGWAHDGMTVRGAA